MTRFEKENDYNRVNTRYQPKKPPQEDLSAPFSGYLYKKNSSGEWQKRFFEINGNYLIYYKNETMTKLLAAVAIPHIGDVKMVGDVNDSKGEGYVIQIDLKEKQYLLRAESYEEAEKWVKHLLFMRDGEITAAELKGALSLTSSDSGSRVSFVDSPIYNPQHQLGGGVKSDFLRISVDDQDDIIAQRKRPTPKRTSDTTWQKAHRSFFSYFCFRCV